MNRKPQALTEMRSVKDMFSMDGKVALVTGAAGGIGRSTAAAFAQNGAKVVLMDIPPREADLKDLCEQFRELYNAECMYVTGDISKPESVDAFLQQALDRYGRLDMVHNHAGIAAWPDNSDISPAAWQKMLDINLSGAFYVARACGKIMKELGIRGSVVTTASVSASIVNSGPSYSATRAGIKHMSNALGIEFATTGIRFNTVSYGYILSGLHTAAGSDDDVEALYAAFERKTPMHRIANLDEVVGPVLYLASDLSTFETASDIIIDGGLSQGRME